MEGVPRHPARRRSPGAGYPGRQDTDHPSFAGRIGSTGEAVKTPCDTNMATLAADRRKDLERSAAPGRSGTRGGEMSVEQRILVTGATGKVGQTFIRRL